MAGDRSASPPTDRVVAVVELLAGEDRALSVADITATLGLSRSTVTAVLSGLESARWVRRLTDRGYVLGPGLLGVAGAVGRRVPLAEAAAVELAELTARTRCGATLCEVDGDALTFLAVEGGPGAFPVGVAVGARLPLRPPAGAVLVAWRSRQEQTDWVARAPHALRPALLELLDLVRVCGAALWRPDTDHGPLLTLLHDVVSELGEHPGRDAVHARLLDQLLVIAGRPFTADDLVSDEPLPLTFLAVPVLGADGHPRYELSLGSMTPVTPRADRDRYLEELRSTAERLSEAIQGRRGKD
ncbi:helix-turn-helix domain-containing protein [Yinghuangia sp. YIM S09857]|uniref:helix-turn-helix domain-containing protein n=1 Tax=Yinghuangia sp. YIM S09857 TaxID=3436929 RepID=UPI003F52FA6E